MQRGRPTSAHHLCPPLLTVPASMWTEEQKCVCYPQNIQLLLICLVIFFDMCLQCHLWHKKKIIRLCKNVFCEYLIKTSHIVFVQSFPMFYLFWLFFPLLLMLICVVAPSALVHFPVEMCSIFETHSFHLFSSQLSGSLFYQSQPQTDTYCLRR